MKKRRHLYKDQIIDMYVNKLQSMNKIGEKLKLSITTIRNVLRENNIEIRTKQCGWSNIYKFNEKFFEMIDTEEKAYWLGFIYADGYIRIGGIMGIGLSIKDIDHLKKFNIALESTYPINIYKYSKTSYKPEDNYCRLLITSLINFNNLINKNITENKSKILSFPTNLIVPNNLIHHFIRGYFDGDGSVSFSTKSKRIYCSIVGTENFLKGIVEHLPFSTNTHKHRNISVIKFTGKKAKQFKDYIYKDANTCLERKKEKFDKFFGGK